ncbi:hypothetical protein [Xanthomonas campestris]|uniref:hypothetical protein n=1 Tax=Xanthomonas campestris TaxID=339 RepID=UPI001E4B4703|nr:hypothetical protein [Xanthomonas campestris]MCC5065609.1 hypothetical protein [Xanthomonas campestris pv. raphani]MEA9752234.1 hypothetical protein [Xanthomonas campestris pv. raphani]MEA9757898.1 hypothetical protein [Xanthomonas campestris pv. raphani]MEA9812862.1 hypothetical protein [Xanthomonas campestris pv. raphani]MEA9890699.1 hypothetical protein [Xanthomonas campestris pv. raphani]
MRTQSRMMVAGTRRFPVYEVRVSEQGAVTRHYTVGELGMCFDDLAAAAASAQSLADTADLVMPPAPGDLQLALR